MVEKLRFLGIDRDVVVDLDDEHSCDEAAKLAFGERLPIVVFKSDEGLSAHEILSRVAEHKFYCSECRENIEPETVRRY